MYPTLHDHKGQEFNYMVSGSMRFYIGDISYDLEEGDSVYFDSGVPHAMRALNGKPAQFIAVVIK
jgi:quercetin dioxygenase-like cupin family protein